MNILVSSPVLFQASLMEEISHVLHTFVSNLCSIAISGLELLSILIILFTTFNSLVQLFKEGSAYARVYLLHGQSIGLTFKLGSEILKTVTASGMEDIWEIVLLVIIKAMMILLIDWELNGHKDHKTAEEMDSEKRAVQDIDSPLKDGFSRFVDQRIRGHRGLHGVAARQQEIRKYKAKIANLESRVNDLEKENLEEEKKEQSA